MGKGTYLGLVPKDDPMFSSGPELFSPLDFSPSSRSSALATDGATQDKSASADEAPETEEDGIRAEAQRRLRVRRMYEKITPSMTQPP